MLKCKDRRLTVYRTGYCRLSGNDCGFSHFAWCKGIIFGILAAITIAYFSYGLIYAWQNAEDRVMIEEIRGEQKRISERMEYLDGRLTETDKTIVRRWKKYEREK